LSQAHEWTQQASIAIEVEAEEIGNGQHRVPVNDSRDQTSANELDPVVGVGFGAREAKGRFTGQGDRMEEAAIQAAKSGVSHFLGIAAVKHLVNHLIVVGRVVSGIGLLELRPVIAENLLELFFIDVASVTSIAQGVISLVVRAALQVE
jgi:hypothetical protein